MPKAAFAYWSNRAELQAALAEFLGEGAQPRRRVVIESSDSPVGAEVVIEGPVLLHEEHDVLNRP